jgi:hypothetical protein
MTMHLRIPFRISAFSLDEFNPLEIPRWNLTILFGRETSRKWRKMVDHDPDDMEARLILASLLRVEKQFEAALNQYREMIEHLSSDKSIHQDPDLKSNRVANIHYQMGCILLVLGKRQEARAEWETVLTLTESGYADKVQKLLLAYPADGTYPVHRYVLILVDHAGNIDTNPLESLEVAWPLYKKWQRAVQEKSCLGVGLADYFPDPRDGFGIWMELPKDKSQREKVRELISSHCHLEGS